MSEESDKPKRRHSVSRILQKLKPKRKKSNEQRGISAGFLSLRSSSTNLSLVSENNNDESASLLRRGSLLEKKNINIPTPTTEERFITLATYNCVMFNRNGVAVQGRLYLTDSFLLFDSKTLVMTVRIKLDWEEVLEVRVRLAAENEPVIAVNGVRERYNFGRFLLNACTTLKDVAKELKRIWSNASSTVQIDESALIQGAKWPCGCFSHLERTLLTNQIVDALPFEIFQKLFIHSAWISTFKEFLDIDEHMTSSGGFVPDSSEGGERTISHVIKNKNGSLKKMQQTQKLQIFTPNIISVTSNYFSQDNKTLASQRWCFVREEESPEDVCRVFLSCQGECEFVHATYTKFVQEEFKKRFKYLQYVERRDEGYLSDEVKVFWGLLVRTRLLMFEKNIWLFVLVIGLYFIGSLLPSTLFRNELSPLLLLPFEKDNDMHSSLVREEIIAQLQSLEQQLVTTQG